MFFHKLDTFKEYLKVLKTKDGEAGTLYNDMLINFTDFFRDEEAFEYFKSSLFPQIIQSKAKNEPLRVWVVACSTGQEAYSMAILLAELYGKEVKGKQIQVFATDLSEASIKKARKGEYTVAEIKAIPPKMLERFFSFSDGRYKVSKTIRDLCTFAPHNILSHPPFSRMDLISCCNLFIYLDATMHKKLLETFHYALNDGGTLILGKSENIAGSALFSQPNRKYKIYSRREGPRSFPELSVKGLRAAKTGVPELAQKPRKNRSAQETDALINSILFTRFIPTYVVIDHAMMILQFKGATSKYLEHTTGKATLNILNMARPEIAFELLDAIHKAIDNGVEVHKPDIEIRNEQTIHKISLDVIPLTTEGSEPLLLVVFSEHELVNLSESTTRTGKQSTAAHVGIKKLKEELAALRAELISVRDEKEKANKTLQIAKEEILSSNEEFQCMNEELETSKEEIESANEELISANQELQTRNEQLAEAYDFSEAIVTTLHEPMLILDKDLRVKSANKAFYKKFLVPQSETEGRLLYELGNHEWDIQGLRTLLESIVEKETQFYDFEITQVFRQIGKKTLLLNARRIVQKAQHEQLILLAFTDTTEKTQKGRKEKKDLEDIISERTAELKQSIIDLYDKNVTLEKMNKELETFTFVSSHDLQEPLRKIRNFASCLLDEEQDKLSDTGKHYLNRMQDTVRRMQSLIEDLLAYSRVKNAVVTFEKCDLNILVEEVLLDFKEILLQNKAKVKYSGLNEVSIIRFQFRQVLVNLISNAKKFAEPSRPLVITIKSEIVARTKFSKDLALPAGNICHISIQDNGIGFEPQYNDRIFEVFQRLNDYEDFKGTGIGLAICKRIVENHHGLITATGRPGKGATFDIYLPA